MLTVIVYKLNYLVDLYTYWGAKADLAYSARVRSDLPHESRLLLFLPHKRGVMGQTDEATALLVRAREFAESPRVFIQISIRANL